MLQQAVGLVAGGALGLGCAGGGAGCMAALASDLCGFGRLQRVVAMAGGTLGGLLACFEDGPVASGLVGFELVGMAGAAEGRDLLSGGNAVWGGVA